MIKLLKPEYLIFSLLTPIGVWAGAKMTWLSPQFYPPSVLSISLFMVFIGSIILREIIFNKTKIAITEIDDKSSVPVQTARYISITLLLITIIIAFSINFYVLITLLMLSGLIMLSGFIESRLPLLNYILFPLLAGGVVMAGGLAIEPKFILTLPGPALPALFSMIFLLMVVITVDVKNIAKDAQSNIRTLPVIIGIPISLIMVIFLFIIFVLVTLFSVLSGWFGTAFKIITIYIIDLPTLVLLILIWGNPNRRTLAIGLVAFIIDWLLSMAIILMK